MIFIKIVNKNDSGYRMFEVDHYEVMPNGVEIAINPHNPPKDGNELLVVYVSYMAYIMNERGKTIDTIYGYEGMPQPEGTAPRPV